MNNVASFLGLIRKAGKVDIGEEPVGAACRSRASSLVVIANDTTDNSIRRASHFASIAKVPHVSIPLGKAQLGDALGRPPCAMISINDIGFAAALIKKLMSTDPTLYTSAYEELVPKAKKSIARKKEKIRHQKKLLAGKCKQKSKH